METRPGCGWIGALDVDASAIAGDAKTAGHQVVRKGRGGDSRLEMGLLLMMPASSSMAAPVAKKKSPAASAPRADGLIVVELAVVHVECGPLVIVDEPRPRLPEIKLPLPPPCAWLPVKAVFVIVAMPSLFKSPPPRMSLPTVVIAWLSVIVRNCSRSACRHCRCRRRRWPDRC